MRPWIGRGEVSFLYRTEAGRIDRPTWIRGAIPLAVALGALTTLWLALAPFVARDPGQRTFFDPFAVAASLYLIVYAFAAIFIAVSWVNLTAKRLRDRGRATPVGLAGLFPLLALCAGALHWLQPRIADFPRWPVWIGDAVVIACFAWTLADCADLFRAQRRP